MFNGLLIGGTTYICVIVRMISDHMVNRIESPNIKLLMSEFVEIIALVYFIGYRALLPELTQIVDMQVPEEYFQIK